MHRKPRSAKAIRVWLLSSLLCLVGCSSNTTTLAPAAVPNQTAQPSTSAKPRTPIGGTPVDGSVKGGVYTNNFFQFSIQYSQAWKIMDTGSPIPPPPQRDSVDEGYFLFWVGTANKQTEAPSWILIYAFKPAASAPNATPDNFLKVQAEAIKRVSADYLKKGQPPPVTAGEPSEFTISGRQLARLDQTAEVNGKHTAVVTLVMAERGYLVSFMFSDPIQDESNPAAKEINSLRFFRGTN